MEYSGGKLKGLEDSRKKWKDMDDFRNSDLNSMTSTTEENGLLKM